MPRKNNQQELVVAWAKVLFEKHGISTIPIDSKAKRPLIRTSEWWSTTPPTPVPVGLISQMRPRNIAVQTGSVSRIVVIDVDDPAACRQWFSTVPKLPSTWTVKTGGGGMHLYYKLPRWLNAPLPRTILWKGTEKHQEVLLLGERSMAITAPSRFTAKMYKWEAGPNPLVCPPTYLPLWVVKMVTEKNKSYAAPPVAPAQDRPRWSFPVGGSLTPREEIEDKLSRLVGAGLRLASNRANQSGWIPCYRIDRDERNPSASVREDGSVVWSPDGSYHYHDVMRILEQS